MMIRLCRMTNDSLSRCTLPGLLMLTVCQHFHIFPLHPQPEVKAFFLLSRSHSRWCEPLTKRLLYTFQSYLLCYFLDIFKPWEMLCISGKVKADLLTNRGILI